MPPQLPFRTLQPVQKAKLVLPFSRWFSSTPLVRASDDQYGAILDSLSPAQGGRVVSDPASIPSRSSVSPPSDSSVSLHKSDRARASIAQRTTLAATSDSIDPVSNASRRSYASQRRPPVSSLGASAVDTKQARAIEQQLARTLRFGDVYAPHDLSPAQQTIAKQARSPRAAANRKPNTRKRGGPDMLDALNINPINHYKNFSMMSEFMSDLGRIKHGRETGFRAVNQRRMAKAVRRAIGIGIMPSVHKHPELLADRVRQRQQISMRSPLDNFKSY